MAERVEVRKTAKLYVGGAFPRSESGHTYRVADSRGRFLANAALASRKDARDAVVAARKAYGGWSARTAYNRGQVVYRIAELMEERRPQLVGAVSRAEGLSARRAESSVERAVDRVVWYAGWADKLAQVVGSTNQVAGPFLNLSTPVPTGVVAVLAPQQSSLLGLVSTVLPVVATGNAAVVVTSYARPLPAVVLAEVIATSDVPGGVVNLLTGSAATLGPWLAAHADVDAIDLAGVAGDAELATALEVAAADTLTRVRRAPSAEPDWSAEPGLSAMTDFTEIRTVWHPVGL